jgi:hypothetical protein
MFVSIKEKVDNLHNFSDVFLVSRVPFPTTHGLAEIQIRMQFLFLLVIVMDAGLPESAIGLNCRKEPFGRK